MRMSEEDKVKQAAREAAFRDAINAVCREFGAEITITDNQGNRNGGGGYGDPIMRIDIDGIYTPEGETVQPWVSFEW